MVREVVDEVFDSRLEISRGCLGHKLCELGTDQVEEAPAEFGRMAARSCCDHGKNGANAPSLITLIKSMKMKS